MDNRMRVGELLPAPKESRWTPDQLEEGALALEYMLTHHTDHGAMPVNLRKIADLPVEVFNPRTESTHVSLIGDLTGQDFLDIAESMRRAARVRYFAATGRWPEHDNGEET